MTIVGLAKTETERRSTTGAGSLKLVPKMEWPAAPRVPFTIHVPDDMFGPELAASDATEPRLAECASSTGESPDSDQASTACVRPPFAVAILSGLAIGYLLGRLRK